MKSKSSKVENDVRDGNDNGGTTARAMAEGAAAVVLHQEQCRPAPGFNRANLELTPEFQENVKAHGVLVPILVRPLEKPDGAVTHEIVAGVRRWKANGMAGHDTLPARSFLLDDAQVRQLRLIENLQRTGLTPLDEARQFQEAVKGGVTVEQLALQVGLKRTAVYDRLRLLDAAPVVQQAVSEGKLEASVGSLLAQIPDAKQQAEALHQVNDGWAGAMSFRDAKEHVREHYCRSLKGAPFNLSNVYVGSIEGRKGRKGPGSTLAGVGSCAQCPRRSGNIPGFDGEPNICTDPPCYQAKVRAAGVERLKEAAQSGQEVHGPAEAGKFFHDGSAHLKDGSYVAVTDRCDKQHWNHDKTWKAALGPDAPPVILAVDALGAVHELYARSAAETALKVAAQAGRVELETGRVGRTSRSDAVEKAREKKTKAMKLGARTAVAAVLEKLVGAVGTVKQPSVATLHSALWPLLAQAAFDTASIDVCDFVAKRRGLAETINAAGDGIRKWLKGRTDVFELARFVVECLVLAPGARGNAWSEPKWEPGLAAAAQLAGVALKAEEPKPQPKAQSSKLKAQEKSQAPGRPKTKAKKAQSKKRK